MLAGALAAAAVAFGAGAAGSASETPAVALGAGVSDVSGPQIQATVSDSVDESVTSAADPPSRSALPLQGSEQLPRRQSSISSPAEAPGGSGTSHGWASISGSAVGSHAATIEKSSSTDGGVSGSLNAPAFLSFCAAPAFSPLSTLHYRLSPHSHDSVLSEYAFPSTWKGSVWLNQVDEGEGWWAWAKGRMAGAPLPAPPVAVPLPLDKLTCKLPSSRFMSARRPSSLALTRAEAPLPRVCDAAIARPAVAHRERDAVAVFSAGVVRRGGQSCCSRAAASTRPPSHTCACLNLQKTNSPR